MDDPFVFLDLPDARAFLRKFPSEVRRRGEACFRSGRVMDLIPEDPGAKYSALVRDGEQCVVDLHYDPEVGWEGNCSCERERQCEHIYAAMSALLAEQSAAAVRGLSAGQPSAFARLALERSRHKSDANRSEGELAERLAAALNRALNRQETAFLRDLHKVYLRCAQTRQITTWDFHEIGLPVNEPSWAQMKIWPAFPDSEHEFWLYVAYAAQQRGLKIPEFMQPVTDFSGIQDRLTRWQRAREVERWKQTLANFQHEPKAFSLLPAGETDFRLMIDEAVARLQWLRPGQTSFVSFKHGDLNQIRTAQEEGRLRLSWEAELLWRIFCDDRYYGDKPTLGYDDPDAPRILGHLLRMPQLESRIVSDTGAALTRPAEPLRWEVVPAASEEEDYRFRLVRSNGEPPPPVLAMFPGNPALYLTRDAVFSGPDAPESLLDIAEENRIPAPAIERSSGVAFLQALEVELPPRLRERVETLPYKVSIKCELGTVFPGGSQEECIVNVVAEAADGHRQTWTGLGWNEDSHRGSRNKGKDKSIVVYDSAGLRDIPSLLEPLKLKQTYGRGLSVRVTRAFPELFATWLKTIPPQITLELKGELASFIEAEVTGRVKLDVTEAEIDWFDLRVVLDVADTTLTADEIKLLLNARGRYVRLQGKGWRRLQYDLSEEENERLARLGLNARELTDEPQRLHALQLADESARRFLPEQQVEQIQRRASEIKARVAPDLPATVTADLRPYQLEGFHFLAYLGTNRFGGILADDMGLGKTLQALAWLVWLRNERAKSGKGKELPTLVVCPKSVMDNWHAEAARFTPGLNVRVWRPSELKELKEQLAGADLHVLNYSQLRSVGESLAPARWLAVILDEGQYIKNPNSQTAQIARSLRCEHRLVLSGTPIENRLLDLWSLMAFAMPGVLGSRAQFGRLFDAKNDPFARRRLASRVRPFVLRRTKAQVAKDLPDRIEEDLFCEMEGEQKTLYRAELKRAQQLLLGIRTQKELAQQQFNFLTSLLRLRQICCHPRLLKEDSKAPSAKTEALLEQLEPLMDEEQKVLVFSQFVEMLDLLRPELEERNWPLFYLSGSTENRGELVKKFQETEGAAVFLISLKAGGFGLNLTAASYVMLFDPWWNPAVENQAIDRTHRIGQTKNVMAYRLLIKDSIEEKIRELQKQKKALAEDVLGEEKFAQSLTLDDLRFLFAD
jgi:hypothetical protein